MNIKRGLIIGIAFLALFGSIFYFNSFYVPKVIAKCSFVEDYSDFDTLMKSTNAVIKGTIKEKLGSYEANPGNPYTDYVVEVNEIIYGTIPNNEIIVAQAGGETDYIGYDGKKHKQLTEFENHPLFKTDEVFILFLTKNDEEDKYYVGTLGYGTYKLEKGKTYNHYSKLTKDEKSLIKEIKKYN